jgi:hypothetical protein
MAVPLANKITNFISNFTPWFPVKKVVKKA